MATVKVQTPESVAVAVSLSRAVKKNKAALLYEGNTDARLYKNFVDWEKCEPYALFGKQNVLTALSILEARRVPGVLAITDADADHVLGIGPASPNALSTDIRDLEGMLINSPAFDKVLVEHEFRPPPNFLDKISKAAEFLGYVRIAAIKNGWHLDFKDIPFNDFFDGRTVTSDPAKIVPTLLACAKNVGFGQTCADIEKEARGIATGGHSTWNVSRGHDMTHVLARTLSFFKGKVVGVDLVESQLRLAFENDHFRTTLLYTAIKNWETDNPPFRILR